MGWKAITGILVTLILFSGLIGVCGTPIMEELIPPPPIEEPQPPPGDLWMPYVPDSEQVDLAFWIAGEIAYVNVTIQFGTPCYAITDWGTATKSGYDIWVDSVIWVWWGICIQMVPPPVSHTYEIGPLENGTYTFTFKAWGTDVQSASFTVQPTTQLLLETDRDTYILGENVTVTLKDIGTEIVSIGGYPAWGIYTYPEEYLVYPKYYAFLLWELKPGENDTITWTQYNAFTNSPVDPGMYVIKDTQGWGLSTYFKIIAAEKIVPDDYPTIQKAINAANDGDAIFVRAGTYSENIVVNKTVSLVGGNRNTTIIDGNETGVVLLIQAVNVAIENFTIRNGGKQFSGIDIFSNGNEITNNIILNNWCGIRLEHDSTDNTIANNKITNNLNGISGELWSNSLVTNNRITNNLLGIWMHLSSGNIIANNTVSGHLDGFWISHSTGNFIFSNTIINNKWSGVSLEYSSNNRIYHNNFMNDGKQACVYGEVTNHWDNDYPSGGNYWSDYTGVDELSGRYQNETGSDGIGDTPYIIDQNNQDRYPLTEPEDQWIPYVPDLKEVDLAFWTANQKAYVNVTITFGDPCINISDWGTITKAGYDVWVDSEIWRWTGGCILVIWSVSHTYELGPLESGTYTFTFQAWSLPVESIVFTITLPSPQIKITGIRPPEGLPGIKVLIIGEGATPNGTVVALLENFTSIVEIGTVEVVTIPVGETIADKEGHWDIWFEVPSFLLPGEAVVRVVDNETQTTDWTTFLVTAAQIIIEYVSPQSGPVGTSVYVSGSGATPYGEVRVYFDETNVANTTAKDREWWSASFEVPDVEPGNYTITVLDVTTNTTKSAIFTVRPPPTIQVYPSEASIGSKITISGEGFTPNQGIFITFEDLLLFSFVMTDENGEFNVTLFVPMVNSGNYTIKAITTHLYQVAIANVSFTVTLGVDTLLSQYASSNSSYYELNNGYEELKASYYSLLNDHDDPQATYNSLLTNYTTLKGDYDSLSSNYNTLEANYNSLNSTYNDLESKYDTLTSDLGTTRNLSYLFIITTIVFIATTVLLFAIRKPKVKPG